MSTYVWNGTTWKSVISGGLYVKDGSVLKQVDHSWVWDGVTWRKYYTKAVPITLTPVVNAWDKITLSWNSIAVGATYVLKRGATTIYSGTGLTFQDTLLMPSTSYTYTIYSYLGTALQYTNSVASTTLGYADLGLSATTASYAQINLGWSVANGSVTSFNLYRGATLIYAGAATGFNDTGLIASTGYAYTLNAIRSGTTIKTDTASATTSARPTSTGSWNGPSATTSGGWTSCTARNLNGPTFPMPVNGYITSFNVLVWSYGGGTGHFNPHIAGHYFGLRNCPGGRAYQNVSGGDFFVGAGNQSTGAAVGGNCSYSTEWDSYSGVPWNYNVSVGTINYWYYTALTREFRSEPWWDESFEDKEIHMETWGVDHLTQVIITDKKARGGVLMAWRSEDHDDSLYTERNEV